MVKVLESDCGDNLSISVAVLDGETAEQEFGRVKEAFLGYQRAHGASPGNLKVEIEAEESTRSEILNLFFNMVSSKDPLLFQFYQKTKEAEVCLVSPKGKRFKTLGFSHAAG